MPIKQAMKHILGMSAFCDLSSYFSRPCLFSTEKFEESDIFKQIHKFITI